MSKLFDPDEVPPPPDSRTRLRGPVLRRNRKGGSLHPEELEKRLAEKSTQEMPSSGWHWPFGWLLIVFLHDGTKRYVDLPASMNHEEATDVRDYELDADDCEGTLLIRKTYEKK